MIKSTPHLVWNAPKDIIVLVRIFLVGSSIEGRPGNGTCLLLHPKKLYIIIVLADFASSAAIPCGIGTYSLSGATNCSHCIDGFYQNDTSQSSCIICPPGKFLIDFVFLIQPVAFNLN